MSLGSYDIFYTRPICAGLLLLAFAMLLWPLIGWILEWRRKGTTGS
jgi:TctA family transporter